MNVENFRAAVRPKVQRSLAVLLDRITDQSHLRLTRSNANLLHVATRSADKGTLLILTNHSLLDVFNGSDLNRTDTDDRTVFEIREQRTGMETALKSAVDTLIRRVQS